MAVKQKTQRTLEAGILLSDAREDREKIKRKLVSPGQIINSPLLPDSHPLKQEAFVISDALEAVTNGMENPEALEALEALDEASPFRPWRSLIAAIKAFYQGDHQQTTALLDEIDPEAPPAHLGPFLLSLIDRTAAELQGEHGYAWKELYRKITENQRFIESARKDLEESRHQGEGYFLDTLILLIQDLTVSYRETAVRLALWGLRTAIEDNFDEEPLIDGLLSIYGKAEGWRLIGLVFMEWDGLSGLLCLLKSLVYRMQTKTITEDEAGEYLYLAYEIMTENQASDDHELLADIEEIHKLIFREAGALFPETFRDFQVTDGTADFFLAAGKRLFPEGDLYDTEPLPVPAAGKPPLPGPSDPLCGKGEPVQLELF